MIEVELHIPASASSDAVSEVVQRICIDDELKRKLKETLAVYPGCIHWHFNRDRANRDIGGHLVGTRKSLMVQSCGR